jgi:hypothetical protein
MKHRTPEPNLLEEYLLERRRGIRRDFLSFLRDAGYSKVQSMRILVEELGVDLRQAKELVHKSLAWNDVSHRDEKFHETLIKVICLDK